MQDPFLDPPAGVPAWASIDDEVTVRRLTILIALVFALGVGGCVIRGADNPADPVVATAGDATSTTAVDGDDPAAPDASADTTGGADAATTTTAAPVGGSTAALAEQLGAVEVTIEFADTFTECLCLVLADEPGERSTGLTGVTDFSGFDGMLFSWGEEVESAFVMIGTPTPLHISWWDEDGRFVSSTEMTPCLDGDADDCERYRAATPFRFAIELPAERGAGLGIDVGDAIVVGGPCAGAEA